MGEASLAFTMLGKQSVQTQGQGQIWLLRARRRLLGLTLTPALLGKVVHCRLHGISHTRSLTRVASFIPTASVRKAGITPILQISKKYQAREGESLAQDHKTRKCQNQNYNPHHLGSQPSVFHGIRILKLGVGGAGHSSDGRGLPSTHGAQGASPALCKPGVVVHACNSSTQKLEADPSRLHGGGFGASLATKDLV